MTLLVVGFLRGAGFALDRILVRAVVLGSMPAMTTMHEKVATHHQNKKAIGNYRIEGHIKNEDCDAAYHDGCDDHPYPDW